jgi:hypothetical protein
VTSIAAAADRRWCHPGTEGDDVRIDSEFEALIPPLSRGELADLHRSLEAEGCRDGLIVWKGQGLLVDGHNRIRFCRDKGILFPVVEKEFADREAVKAYIIREQLGRRNLSPTAESYLRGTRYNTEKKPHGGARTGNGASAHPAHLKTDQNLGAEYQVDPATIRRDGKFAEAMDTIARHCGPEARNMILSRESGLTRGGVRRLAHLAPEAQRHFVAELRAKGKPPRQSRRGKGDSLTVPADPKALVGALLAKLGIEALSEVSRSLAEAIQERRENGTSEEEPREGFRHQDQGASRPREEGFRPELSV